MKIIKGMVLNVLLAHQSVLEVQGRSLVLMWPFFCRLLSESGLHKQFNLLYRSQPFVVRFISVMSVDVGQR